MNQEKKLKRFDQLRVEQQSFLEAVLWRLTGDRDLYAEALQEALLLIWKHLAKLQGPTTRSYLYRIAQTAASKSWRKRSQGGTGLPPLNIETDDDPAQNVNRQELLTTLRQAVGALPSHQSWAITMRYLEEKEYREMALEWGCSEVAMRSYVSQGLANLRKQSLFALNDNPKGCSHER